MRCLLYLDSGITIRYDNQIFTFVSMSCIKSSQEKKVAKDVHWFFPLSILSLHFIWIGFLSLLIYEKFFKDFIFEIDRDMKRFFFMMYLIHTVSCSYQSKSWHMKNNCNSSPLYWLLASFSVHVMYGTRRLLIALHGWRNEWFSR